MGQDVLLCERHGSETRLTCAECGTPICPGCLVRIDVGLRCERCAAPTGVEAVRPSLTRRAIAIGGLVAGAALVTVAFVLVASGGGSSPAPQAVLGGWEAGPPLQLVRGSTTALSLSDGRVAVVGGGLGSVPLAATEVFDPASRTWIPSAGLHEARRGHGLVRLHDGRLLGAGGIAGGELLGSAEVFDPSSGAWTPVGDLTHPRLGHTMTVLADGTVLATGGTGETGTSSQGSQTVRPLAAAELFDPGTGEWTPVGELLVPRFEHTATRLPDGRVLIAGGIGSEGDAVGPVASAELYDPVTRTFSRTGRMTQPRTDHAAVSLAVGRVLAVGGDVGTSALSGVEVYDPVRGAWSQTASLRQPRRGHSATLLDDGTVLVAGGEFFSQGARTSLASAERYDPDAGTWADAGAMSCPRSEHAAAVLPGGAVLVVAGDAAFPGQPPIAQSCVDLYIPGSRSPAGARAARRAATPLISAR